MRDHFLLDPGVRFLNHGSFGACPREVFDTFVGWQREMERNPVEFLGRRSGALLQSARGRLGEALNAAADDLAFVPNATTGVNIAARSIALRPGDEVLGTDHEYGACEAAWQAVCAAAGAAYRRVEVPLPYAPGEFVERVLAALTPRTRVVFVSHLTSTTALIFPVAELCAALRARGVLSVVDGAHAPGHVPVDLATIGADFYTGNAHKWWCAPKGSAFLHVRPEHQAGIAAPVISWGAVAEAATGDGGHTGFDAYAGRTALERRLQWLGTRDIAAWLTVPAALDFRARHGWAAMCATARQRALATRDRVRARNGLAPVAPDEAHGQMVLIPVKVADAAGAEALRAWLFDAHRIEVPVTRHGPHTFVRLSVQPYTGDDELDALVDALAEAGV